MGPVTDLEAPAAEPVDTYQTESDRRRAAHHAVVAAIIAHMPGWIQASTRHEHWVVAEHTMTGAQIAFIQYGNRVPMEVHAEYPRFPSGSIGEPYSYGILKYGEPRWDRICVSPTREPRLIARDVLRRLGNPLVEVWPKVAKRHAEDLVEDDRADQVLESLIGGGHRSPHGYHKTYEGYTGYGRVRVSRSRNHLSVSLELDGLSPEQALYIHNYLKKAKAGDE